MPEPPQGLFEYAGIVHPISAQFTLSHGISPSRAVIRCAPQQSIIWKCGPMVLSYGGVRIEFFECTADKISVVTDGSGNQIWAVHILDRRWKWKECGRISGYYNVRRGSERIVEDTEKTPRELATLCLEALDEEDFDVSILPEEPRPEIEWDYTLPAEALAKLCDAYGCRVTLGLDNRIKICKVGEGEELVLDGLTTEGDVEPDPPERPDALVFAAARTRFQFDLELEAVGLDIDNNDPDHPGGVQVIKPIDELSYAPVGDDGTATWRFCDVPYFKETLIQQGKDHYKLARESVFRWYRIKTPFTLLDLLSEEEDAQDETIEDIERILPIETIQIEKEIVLGREEPRPAWVHGDFNPQLDSVDNHDDDEVEPRNKVTTLYRGSFSIDTARGIVKFANYVYKETVNTIVEEGGTESTQFYIDPADLKLRVAFSLRELETLGWRRAEKRRDFPPPLCGTKPEYLVRDDIALELVYIYDKSGAVTAIETNEDTVVDQADYYLNAAELEYQFEQPASLSYAGFLPINPDGAIQQVTWWIDGKGFAYTRASRHREELIRTPSYKERRRIERAREEAKKERETRRQTKSKHDKGQA